MDHWAFLIWGRFGLGVYFFPKSTHANNWHYSPMLISNMAARHFFHSCFYSCHFPVDVNLLRDINHDVSDWFIRCFVHWLACPYNCELACLLAWASRKWAFPPPWGFSLPLSWTKSDGGSGCGSSGYSSLKLDEADVKDNTAFKVGGSCYSYATDIIFCDWVRAICSKCDA